MSEICTACRGEFIEVLDPNDAFSVLDEEEFEIACDIFLDRAEYWCRECIISAAETR